MVILTMNRENWPLIIHEPVEFQKQAVAVQDLQEDYQSFQRNLENMPQIHEEKPNDVNM